MSRWFRLYDDTINDPKVIKLPEVTRWHWIALLCVASKNDGTLPALDDVAIQLRVTAAKATEIIASLAKFGLLDKTETGFAPHNWNGRQYKSDVSTERVKRFRNGQRNVSCNVSETPPETETDTETDTEKKKARVIALDDGWPSGFREQFWSLYPHKIGKADAVAKLERTRKRGVAWAVLMDGLRRYIATKPVDRPWCNPATWLNQARWEDQPAGSVPDPLEEAGINWDAVLTSYKRFGVWSKYAGPDLDSPGCRVPADMLAKHGLTRGQGPSIEAPRLKSMGGLN